jgi:hypothetical protein
VSFIVPTLRVTAIKLAKKTPSPAGEGWGEGELQTRKPFKIPLIPAFSLKGEGAKSSDTERENDTKVKNG